MAQFKLIPYAIRLKESGKEKYINLESNNFIEKFHNMISNYSEEGTFFQDEEGNDVIKFSEIQYNPRKFEIKAIVIAETIAEYHNLEPLEELIDQLKEIK